MTQRPEQCPDCEGGFENLDRRRFLKTAGAAAIAIGAAPNLSFADSTKEKKPEAIVKKLYDSLDEKQRKSVCFAWDHKEPGMGLLRTHVSNNWHITKPQIGSNFFKKDQQDLIRAIFEGLYNPEWVARVDKQLKDDAGGYGRQQNIAIFGEPGTKQFEFVMTGRHLTIRCDGDSAENVAFGGPIFYGHAASGFNEKVGHPGNVYWPLAIQANKVYEMLDGKQREKALVAERPGESDVAFQGGKGKFPGIAVADMASDQKAQLQKVLMNLLDPYRKADQTEAMACLKAQGGLDKCSLAFYKEGDLGNDGQWDNWRLEGPSFVWYFRGTPHVHVWVNVAADPSIETNAVG